ncbi:2-succinyl-6-hydroxy-2,4-cyclohexadiene-1-carboxylate synthase [Vibrio sinensis]|uniref:Putative 2-succinyl-6-hydroxy-2,4-cyclohexadiene-1-carboxylate synthase n=1 Tax=Vibrio sinensis TaxID=2302434 RepID=A0A3A6QUG7_9VIBR|nr:2-succinyl-6-hydroxy-2,4-cyclohexadiene-1-carboxylate synthase [Vibrio sinensis]RJX71999.1 2-succinyl-6-hydroxy-2,4-cyclohexadiene-1-carboxylate synthase [Vibrio sinensis]
MLYSRSYHAQSTQYQPVVVFLHGLLGSGEDWLGCIQNLKGTPCITIDLPGHGQSRQIDCSDFLSCCKRIEETLLQHINSDTPILLVGYSMGGRIAMSGIALNYFPSLNIQYLIVEGGNFGLSSELDRKKRYQNDQAWAKRFTSEPIEHVLSDWYQQSVFSSLNHEQRQTLTTKRSANLGASVGRMLLATSLAKQEYLLEAMLEKGSKTHYVFGAQDEKFRQMAKRSGLSYSQVANAGHNVHHEQPLAFANIIKNQFQTHFGEQS